jgi:hypothetical protein
MNNSKRNRALVTFGDSWPAGAELNGNEVPYGNVLSELLSYKTYTNMAQPATSNDHLILQMHSYIQHEHHNPLVETDAVFFITSPARTMVYGEHNTPVEIYPWSDMSKGDVAYYYYKYMQTPMLEWFRLNSSILALQQMCTTANINDYYVVGWSECKFDMSGINLSKIYKNGLTTMSDWLGCNGDHEFTQNSRNKYIYPNTDHPNQLGHNLIASKLSEWITST